jgi:hypothetical protein
VLLGLPGIVIVGYGVARALAPDAARATIDTASIIGVELYSVVTCAIAAKLFDRGDYLRLAWATQAASFALLVVAYALEIWAGPTAYVLVRVVLTFGANATGVLGVVWFARAYRIAGLELPGSAWGRRAGVLVAAIVALVIGTPSFVAAVKQVAGGDVDGLRAAFSSLGDVGTFVLIAPLLMTALALRGGVLAWPWALFSAGTFAWLLFDTPDAIVLTFYGGEAPGWITSGGELFRIAACILQGTAAVAQIQLIRMSVADDARP